MTTTADGTDGASDVRPSRSEASTRQALAELFARRPIPDAEVLDHIELFMRPQRISEVVTLGMLYQRILGVHGVVMEFGVRWGRHLSVFTALRAAFEPFNMYRRVVGFDTFEGFADASPQDGASSRIAVGEMAVTPGYDHYLDRVLALHEAEAPMAHIRRFELCRGDAPEQLADYLRRRPDTLVALAYFDMDVYRPTRECLELLLPHMPAGAVIAFDECMHPDFPGEGVALKEVLDVTRYRVERFPHSPYPAFVVL